MSKGKINTTSGGKNMAKQTIGHYKTKKEAEKKARELRAYKIGKRPIRVVKRDIGYDVMVPV
jgi:flagellar hook assembly protein FlgD